MLKTFPQSILVGVAEPDARRQPAIERAAVIAQGSGAAILLFHAAFESASSGRPFFDSKRLAQSRGEIVALRARDLERHAAALRARGIETQTMVVWDGPRCAQSSRIAAPCGRRYRGSFMRRAAIC